MNEFLEHRTTQSEFKASEMALPLSLYKPEIENSVPNHLFQDYGFWKKEKTGGEVVKFTKDIVGRPSNDNNCTLLTKSSFYSELPRCQISYNI